MNILGGGGEGRGVEGARKARDKEQQVGRGEGGGRGRKEERRGDLVSIKKAMFRTWGRIGEGRVMW